MVEAGRGPARILVHDYSGHPGQVELSRGLARRGHQILHVHCGSYQTGKGALENRPGDPPTFTTRSVELPSTFARYAPLRRLAQELDYGRRFSAVARRFQPDVVLSSNDPLFAKAVAAGGLGVSGVPWVFWLQDVYSVAMAAFAERRLGAVGRPAGKAFGAIERSLARRARAVVAITPDFLAVLDRWGVPAERCHVIENWGPVADVPVMPKASPWAAEHGFADRFVILYAGTLGLKHDPGMLMALARRFESDPAVAVVVVSEGAGARWLEREAAAARAGNLSVLPYQPFERLPEMLGAADVLTALLSPLAGTFSVPSKVLTYLCAGRPLLAAVPAENLAARTIEAAGAGVVVASGDQGAFAEAAQRLRADPATRKLMGKRARAFAEREFDVEGIVDRFEAILLEAATSRRRGPRA